jgi:hypothetical protein
MQFEAIRAITWSVRDPGASLAAFTGVLGLQAVNHGRISDRQAAAWGLPAMAGAPFAAVMSADRPRVMLRFVGCDTVEPVAPLHTFGWNAAELHVRDVKGLADRLRDGPFELIGSPRDLLGNGAVRAMQVLGPNDELLYLTQISQAGMQHTYGRAESEVGRPFIVVLGVQDQARTLAHYQPLARFTTDPREFRITVLARAHGMDPEISRFRIASLVMRQAFRIETDAYPSTARKRPVPAGRLPGGLALVTATYRGEADDRFSGGLERGPDGEWLELIPAGGVDEAVLLNSGQLV